jgi:hypothetical protein
MDDNKIKNRAAIIMFIKFAQHSSKKSFYDLGILLKNRKIIESFRF